MSSVYTRFLSGGPGSRSAETWAEAESFLVGRTRTKVDYRSEPSEARATSTSAWASPWELEAPSTMANQTRQLPPMPEIGKHESYYAKLIHSADKEGNTHQHEAAKVGQYITLALDPSLSWDEKLKYFRHAIKRHCVPPPYPDDDVWMFYQQLADLVRQQCGQEALRLASTEDDLYAARLSMGQERERLEDEAETFFQRLLGSGDQCPEWFNEADFSQLKLIRDQWI